MTKSKVEFNGNMDEYRAAVNANMNKKSYGYGEVSPDKKELVMIRLADENERLKNELDTARKAMANLHGKVAAREVEYEDRIKELETQISNERLIRKENDYDVPMKGITL